MAKKKEKRLFLSPIFTVLLLGIFSPGMFNASASNPEKENVKNAMPTPIQKNKIAVAQVRAVPIRGDLDANHDKRHS